MQHGEHAGYFNRCRRAEARPEGNIPIERQIKTGNVDSFLLQDGKHAKGVVAPMMRAARADFIERTMNRYPEIDGRDGRIVVWIGRNCGQSSKVNGCRHDKAISVVGMLANQVHTSRSHKQDGLVAKAFLMEFFDTAYILHESSLGTEIENER